MHEYKEEGETTNDDKNDRKEVIITIMQIIQKNKGHIFLSSQQNF